MEINFSLSESEAALWSKWVEQKKLDNESLRDVDCFILALEAASGLNVKDQEGAIVELKDEAPQP